MFRCSVKFPRERIRQEEGFIAKAVIRHHRFSELSFVGADAAAAICMGDVMIRSEKLRDMLAADFIEHWCVHETFSEAADVYSLKQTGGGRFGWWDAAFQDGWTVCQSGIDRRCASLEQAEAVHQQFQERLAISRGGRVW
jgi:hypothetical protein